MLLDKLNPQQKEAVISQCNVLITACPGSGKTRVLTHKIGYEIEKLNSSKQFILALTFTNRAADEIKRRLEKMNLDASRLWAGTIHSFCLEWILRPYAGYNDRLKNGFAIADQYYCEQILKELKRNQVEDYVSIVTRINRSGHPLNDSVIKQEIANKYHKRLKSESLIDYDLILYYAFRLLTDVPQIATTLSSMFAYIFVDEYQDTQDLQYGIIGQIMKAGNGANRIFLVGDPDQAIYSSLGGVAKSVSEIKKEIGGYDIREMFLSGNYRSTQRIIDFYRNFQSNDIPIISLADNAAQSGIITFNDYINKNNLYEEIAKLINLSLEKGIPEHEICVLAPQWWLITKIGKRLKQLLPHVNFDATGLSPIGKSKENIWYLLARLLLTRPSANMYVTRIRWANDWLRELNSIVNLCNDEFSSGKKILRLLNSITPKEDEGLDYLTVAFNQVMKFLKINIEDHLLLKQQWNSFFEGAKNRILTEEYDVPTDIESFRSMFCNMKGVLINTCQGVKGEEFQTVIAFGLLRNYLPHWSEIDWSDPTIEVPSSKKLLYVIASRARTNLHLIAERGRTTRSNRSLEINRQLASVEFEYDEL
ncbi:ATP-dependent helicase [Brevibacillus laterosporus]|uniref:ATP-dependent helicase n=1 Tax=Brevibacillus laterosporus TaxID=1465 RepID=A0AAP8QG84_BRELA|nr:ATP-dependent helicase [Brevibacillus laterosporus]PPA87737.1 ATP-dependent helicase [Brevibacillus laterosporus]PPB08866.1 ATP-dependent helicase [Brevibacillus laterosporus]